MHRVNEKKEVITQDINWPDWLDGRDRTFWVGGRKGGCEQGTTYRTSSWRRGESVSSCLMVRLYDHEEKRNSVRLERSHVLKRFYTCKVKTWLGATSQENISRDRDRNTGKRCNIVLIVGIVSTANSSRLVPFSYRQMRELLSPKREVAMCPVELICSRADGCFCLSA